MDKLYIHKQVKIRQNKVWVNDNLEFNDGSNLSFADFAKTIYKQLDCKYRKFYKMDAMSKLGFLASEYLLSDIDMEAYHPEEKSIILANESASLNTDVNYQLTISDMPSPAVFVYTLPNIVIGEISIRHIIQGETTFFVDEEFNPGFFYNYIANIFTNTTTKLCVAGWLEMNIDDNYIANLYLVLPEQSNREFNENNLK